MSTLRLFCLVALLGVQAAAAQGIITTIAGADWVFPADGRPALEAPVSPSGEFGPVALDAAGNIFLSDFQNRMIFKIDARGILTIYAGDGIDDTLGDGIPARQASLKLVPGTLATDSAGNLYVNQYTRIRKISPEGIITTPLGGIGTASGPFVGLVVDGTGAIYSITGSRVYKHLPNGSRVTVTDTGFNMYTSVTPFEQALALDSANNLYVTDPGNRRVLKIAADGRITTVAGGASSSNPPQFQDGMLAVGAPIQPVALHVDRMGNLYLHSVVSNPGAYKVTPDGKIRRVPFLPSASDAAGNLYAGVFRMAPAATAPTRYAGNGQYRALREGVPAVGAVLNEPKVVGADGSGNLYVAVHLGGSQFQLCRVDKDGILTKVPGAGLSARAVDRRGVLYDVTFEEVRKISATGTVTRTPLSQYLFYPGIPTAVDDAGNIYVQVNFRLYRITPAGEVSPYVGNGNTGFSGDGGLALNATFGSFRQGTGVTDLAVDRAGNLYLSDIVNYRVRKVDTNGVIRTVAGNGQAGRALDRMPALQAPILPGQLAVDGAGNLYIEDADRIRKLTPDGMLTLVAGGGDFSSGGDGSPATQAGLGNVSGMRVDDAGNIYIGDRINHKVRMVLAAAPTLRAAASTAALAGVSGGSLSLERTIAVSTPVAGLAFTATSNAPWLRITPPKGTLPASLALRGDPGALEPGVHTATVTVTSPYTNPNRIVITVTFTVSEAGPARLQLDREAVSLAAVRRGGAVTASFRVVNAGGGLIDFLVAPSTARGGPWLTVATSRGRASAASPAAVTLRADPAALAPGTYSGRVEVTSVTTGETAPMAVTLAVAESPHSIVLSQTGLTFVAVLGGGRVPPQTFGVLNAGSGVMSWTIGATTFSGGAG